MDFELKDGLWILNINMIQSMALAVVTYYLGVWVKSKVSLLELWLDPADTFNACLFYHNRHDGQYQSC